MAVRREIKRQRRSAIRREQRRMGIEPELKPILPARGDVLTGPLRWPGIEGRLVRKIDEAWRLNELKKRKPKLPK